MVEFYIQLWRETNWVLHSKEYILPILLIQSRFTFFFLLVLKNANKVKTFLLETKLYLLFQMNFKLNHEIYSS